MTTAGDPVAGGVAPALVAEFDGLELWTATATVARGADRAGRQRLGRLSGQFRAAELIRERAGRLLDPAYLVFERQVGMDPARPPTALENGAREVVVTGALTPIHAVDDVRLAVLVEAGLPLMALDARRTRGPWCLRAADEGERHPGAWERSYAARDLVVADPDGPVAPIIGDPPRPLAAGSRCREVVLFAVRVPGVPSWEVSEAVWRAVHYLALT